MFRHAIGPASPVHAIAIAVVEPALLALLVAATTVAQRPRAGTEPATQRTVSITSVAAPTEKEHLAATAASADHDSQRLQARPPGACSFLDSELSACDPSRDDL